jgi:hypothetical protein
MTQKLLNIMQINPILNNVINVSSNINISMDPNALNILFKINKKISLIWKLLSLIKSSPMLKTLLIFYPTIIQNCRLCQEIKVSHK